jgi:transcriptional regulator with XRE-family HTH domain
MKYEDWRAEQMKDPVFAAAFEWRKPDFDIARQVIQQRLELGWSQAVLADKAHLPQSYIANLEDARSNPPLFILKRIAKALGCRLKVTFEPKGAA